MLTLQIKYLLMQAQQPNPSPPFFKGISLSEYMKDMNCPEDRIDSQTYDESNDLYQQCLPISKNVVDYAIREIDEDNYDESLEQHLVIEPMHAAYDLQKSRIRVQQNVAKKGLLQRKGEIKGKNLSSSPVKDMASPKKEMIRSLYGHSFAAETKAAKEAKLLSTLGLNNWRGKHKSLNRKQLQIRDKHKRHYQQLLKYQNVINQRFENKIHSIRIDGIKDKIHQRGPQRFTHKCKQ